MYLQKADLYTHIYEEIIETISRENDTIVTTALNAAEREVASYLSKFDLLQLFGDNATPPTIEDAFLKQLCVSVAAWNFCKRDNPNINLEMLRTNYEDAIKTLEKIQSGKMDPEWPRRQDNPDTTGFSESQTINWSANKKLSHDF